MSLKVYRSLIVVVLCLASGCALAKGYRGPNLPRAELATIRAHGVTIHQVDDVEIGSTASGILVPAGQHKIYFTVNASNYNAPEASLELKELDVTLSGSQEYLISSKRGLGPLCAWEVNKSSGSPDYQDHGGCL